MKAEQMRRILDSGGIGCADLDLSNHWSAIGGWSGRDEWARNFHDELNRGRHNEESSGFSGAVDVVEQFTNLGHQMTWTIETALGEPFSEFPFDAAALSGGLTSPTGTRLSHFSNWRGRVVGGRWAGLVFDIEHRVTAMRCALHACDPAQYTQLRDTVPEMQQIMNSAIFVPVEVEVIYAGS
jgi:hypothetical protein